MLQTKWWWLNNDDRKNNDDKCFQYAITVVLDHQGIKYKPERISKTKPFTDKYNWKTKKKKKKISITWEKFESKNKLIVLSVLYVSHNSQKIKYESNNSLMIPDGRKLHYLAVKKLPVLLRRITSWKMINN